MKTVTESMRLRNTILENLERAETEDDANRRQSLMNIAIVGGGPSGVEIAGALAEMKKTVVPRDYPDLDSSHMEIYLINSGDRLLKSMDKVSSLRAEKDHKGNGYCGWATGTAEWEYNPYPDSDLGKRRKGKCYPGHTHWQYRPCEQDPHRQVQSGQRHAGCVCNW